MQSLYAEQYKILIDYVTIYKRFKNAVTQCKTYSGVCRLWKWTTPCTISDEHKSKVEKRNKKAKESKKRLELVKERGCKKYLGSGSE